MIKTTAGDVCSTLRAFARLPASHPELVLIFQNLASMVKRPSALGEEAKNNIIDSLDEIVGQLEQDEVNQAEEVTA